MTVRLSLVGLDDRAFYESAFADPRIWRLTKPPPESFDEVFRLMWPGTGNPRCFIWTIFDGEDRVGSCALFVSDTGLSGEYGGWVVPEAHHRGCATQATELALSFGRDLGLVRIDSRPAQDNTPARRVLERVGMRLEAVNRNGFFRDGRLLDELVYVWTKEE